MGWSIIWDFNEILYHVEKVGGRERVENQMALFRRVLEEGNLFDLGWKGAKFTLCNKHEDETFTKERLDQVLANSNWMECFSDFNVVTLPAISSDHQPIMLDFRKAGNVRVRQQYHFKYEANYSKEEGYSEVMKTAWKISGLSITVGNYKGNLNCAQEDCNFGAEIYLLKDQLPLKRRPSLLNIFKLMEVLKI